MKTWFSKSAHRALVLLIVVLCAAKASTATTAVLLTDEQLITSSRVILLGDVLSIRAQWDPSHTDINTYVKFRLRIIHYVVLANEVKFQQSVCDYDLRWNAEASTGTGRVRLLGKPNERRSKRPEPDPGISWFG